MRLELAHQLGVPSGGEVGVDSLLEAAQVQLVEAGDLGLRKIRVGELGERRAAPERECLARLPFFQVSLEPCEVELVVVNPDQVAGRLREQALACRAPSAVARRRPEAPSAPSRVARPPRVRR